MCSDAQAWGHTSAIVDLLGVSVVWQAVVVDLRSRARGLQLIGGCLLRAGMFVLDSFLLIGSGMVYCKPGQLSQLWAPLQPLCSSKKS